MLRRHPRNAALAPDEAARVPPGQVVTDKWPVLHEGGVPRFDPRTWDFEVAGEVERPMRWTIREFLALPHVKRTCDIHCVTSWSRLGMEWGGVPFSVIEDLVRPTAEARFVIQEAEEGYLTNLPIEDHRREDVLLADWADGRPLDPEHGGPVRMLVPHRYLWKSAKWLRKLHFSDVDVRGYWEVRGYHNRADPWQEERFSHQEDPPHGA